MMRKLWRIIWVVLLAILAVPIIALVLFAGALMVNQLWRVAMVEPELSRILDTVPQYPGSSVKTTTLSYAFSTKEVEYKFIDWDRNNYTLRRILATPADPGQNKARFSSEVRQFYKDEMAKQSTWRFYAEGINDAFQPILVFVHTQDARLFLTIEPLTISISLRVSRVSRLPSFRRLPMPTPPTTPTPRPPPTPTPTPPPPPVVYSVPELKYHLITNFNNVFYVDPDFYPVAREGQEEKNALEQFNTIKADTIEFSAILRQLGLPNKTDYTNQEKLLVYREHKKLTLAVELTASGDAYNFVLRAGEGQGERIEGTITTSFKITVLKREPSLNTYPICLARGTLIDAPNGPVPVEQLRKGMVVWTADDSGKRLAAVVEKTVVNAVPSLFRVARVTLNDGRSVTASAGHPVAGGRALGDYRVGDVMDGTTVIAMEHLAYDSSATYDLLPSGETGLYWANGILLKSTLSTD